MRFVAHQRHSAITRIGRWRTALLAKPASAVLLCAACLSPLVAGAGSEADFQAGLDQLRAEVRHWILAPNGQAPSAGALGRLDSLAEEIRSSSMLLDARFADRTAQLAAMGPTSRARHERMARGYRSTADRALALIGELRAASEPPDQARWRAALADLAAVLDEALPTRRAFIYGSLPYRRANLPSRQPIDGPPIAPAYAQAGADFQAADLDGTPEAPIDEDIVLLAESLEWNPTLLYDWVKNHIATEWYWGCMKGAKETLRQKSGNDCDQAALLVALLRASAYPARFVRGVIEFFPGIETAKEITGIESPTGATDFFRKAGIPFRPIVAAGRVSNLQVEHVWIETLVPYGNFHGTVVDASGEQWVALDTSIKTAGYAADNAADLFGEFDFASLRDDYLNTLHPATPLDYVRASVGGYLGAYRPGDAYDDLLLTRAPEPEHLKLLPAGLPFREVLVTHEYTEIPDELRHKVRFRATAEPDREIFDFTTETLRLSNQEIALDHEPETVEDHQTINAFGSLDTTPAYLVRLRPTLKLNGENMVVATEGLTAGDEYELAVDLIAPAGTESFANRHVAGGYAVLTVVAQQAVAPAALPEADKDAWRYLYEESVAYVRRWNAAEEELAALLHLRLTRPLPTVVTLGAVVDVTLLLNTPQDIEWKGVYVDADLRAVEAVAATNAPDAEARVRDFMRLSALEGSALESRVLEDDLRVESICTAEVLARAADASLPILSIDAGNAAALLPGLPFASNVIADIAGAVRQGMQVRIPERALAYLNWTGVGYIKEDPATGEAGYMLSGAIAGGMSAGPWEPRLSGIFQAPQSGPPNPNPAEAARIYKLADTDRQEGLVGEKLAKPLRVMVLDAKGRPVQGASVLFTVRAGGGQLSAAGPLTTDGKGIAAVELTLGEHTGDNAEYVAPAPGQASWQQVGDNLVDAQLATNSANVVFSALGFPKAPASLTKILGDGQSGVVLSLGPVVAARVADAFGNPLANLPVGFAAAQPGGGSCGDPAPLRFIDADDPCLLNLSVPLQGECASATAQRQQVTDARGVAALSTLMGGVPGADYPVAAVYVAPTQTFSQVFHLFTLAEESCALRALLSTSYPVNEFGQNIKAAAVGETVVLQARLVAVKGNGACVCLDSGFDAGNAQVTFAGLPGTALGGGFFGRPYSPILGLNTVHAEATAFVSNQGPCGSCAQSGSRSAGADIEVFGVQVDLALDPDEPIVIDDLGFTQKDYVLRYDIRPAEYGAGSAYLFVFRDGELYNFYPIARQGEGTFTWVKGAWLDPRFENGYTAQVVLNYGSTHQGESLEIRSKAVPLLGVFAEDVRLVTRVDRINGDVCGAAEPLRFILGRDAKVTIRVDGSVISPTIGGQPVPVQDLPFPAGGNEVLISRDMVPYPGEHPFTVTAVFLDDPNSVPHAAKGKIVHDLTIDSFLPVGHTFVKGVDLQDGHLTLSREDISMSGLGTTLGFQRSYGSGGNRSSGVMGAGWVHSFESHVVLDDCGHVIVVGGEGSGMRFSNPSPGPGGLHYKAQAGYHGSLVERPDGSFDFYTKGRTLYHYEKYGSGTQANEWTLRYIEDTHGNRLTLRYDSAEPFNLLEVEDATGRKLQFDYERFGPLREPRISRITGPLGLEVNYDYDEYGNLIRAARGNRVDSYDYTTAHPIDKHNLVRVTDPDGDVVRYEYFAEQDSITGYPPTYDWNRHIVVYAEKYEFVKSVTEGFGSADAATTFFTYDLVARKRAVKDARGSDLLYELNDYGCVVKYTDPLGNVTQTKWAMDVGVPDVYAVETTDPKGRVTQFEYDANGNQTLSRDALGHESTSDWHPVFNRPLSATDANGHKTTYTYDAFGNLTSQTDAQPATSIHTYFPNGKRESLRNARGYTTWFQYDAFGNLSRVEDPMGGVTRFVYDERSRLLERIDARNQKTTYEYDDLDQVTAITDALGNRTASTYYPSGLKKTETDARQKTTTFEYDALKRLTRVRDPLGQTVQYAYDANGNRIRETNKRGKVTENAYDAGDRLSKVKNAEQKEMFLTYDEVGNKKTVVDYNGHTTAYVYDALYRLERVVNPAGDATLYEYDAVGNRTRVVAPEPGRETRHEYDAVNRPVKTIDALGHAALTEYDAAGNATRTTDRNQRVTRQTHDANNRLTATTDPLGHSATFEYDAAGNRTKQTDRNGHATRYVYDAVGRLAEVHAPDTSPLLYTYDEVGNVKTFTDARGALFTSFYDDLSRLERVEFTDPQTSGLVSTVYTYDANGNRVSVKNARGFTTTQAYDALDRLTTVTDPHNRTMRYEYDAVGNRRRELDKRGIATEWVYDALDRPVRVERDGAMLSLSEYDKVGNQTGATDANNHTTRMEYDSLNRVTRIVAPGPGTIVTEFTYDFEGNRLTERNPEGDVTTFSYDELNRTRTIGDPEQNVTTYEYDPVGNRTKAIPPKGSQCATAFEYDSNNRLRKITDALGAATVYEHDANGNVTAQVFPNGGRVEVEYDTQNRPVREKQIAAGQAPLVTEFTYDPGGNRTSWKDPKGQTVTYDYDELDLLVARHYPASAGVFPHLRRVDYAYDANGNVATVKESQAVAGGGQPLTRTTAFAYDRFDRMTAVTDPDGKAIGYTYDAAGNRKSVTDPDNVTTTYAYDDLNRVTAVLTAAGHATTYVYYPDNLPKEIRYPNATRVEFAYDRANRAVDVHNIGPHGTLSRYALTYDPHGNPLRMVETQEGATDETTYTYDRVDRLETVAYPADAEFPNGRRVAYAYDSVGNRTSEIEKGDAGQILAQRVYAYNSLNRLTTVTDTLTQQQTAYEYDANGNATRRTGPDGRATEFVYDARDHLRVVRENAQAIAAFAYDYQGLRVRKQAQGVETRYVYDERSVLVETDAGGVTVAKYDYADRLISMTHRNQGAQFYHFGPLDSIANLTNPDGSVRCNYKYDAWGNFRARCDASYNSKTFTGKEYDKETGLYYFGARFYDPKTGRFLTQDPYRGQIDQPPSLHRYLYAYNNPTRNIDTLGYATSRFSNFLRHLRFAAEAVGESVVAVGSAIKQRTVQAVEETVFTAMDAGQFVYKAAKYAATGEFEKTRPVSDIGKAIAQGASAGDMVTAAVKGIVNKPGEIYRALASGDPDRIMNACLDVSSGAAGFAGGRALIGKAAELAGGVAKGLDKLKDAAVSAGRTVKEGVEAAANAGRDLVAKVVRAERAAGGEARQAVRAATREVREAATETAAREARHAAEEIPRTPFGGRGSRSGAQHLEEGSWRVSGTDLSTPAVRPGLETRTRKEFLRMGQLTETEYQSMRQLAKEFDKDIVLSGALSETDVGMKLRYSPDKWDQLGWRAEKPFSGLVDRGVGDIDLWEGSGLTAKEIQTIRTKLHGWEADTSGYSLKYYPTEASFGGLGPDPGAFGPGALVFRKSGAVERILGKWQR